MSYQTSKKHWPLVTKLTAVVFSMFLFGFALVPLYDIICDITGLNGKTGVASAAALEQGPDLSREVTIKFDATTGTAPWNFEPIETTMKVHPGGIYTTHYIAKNKLPYAAAGQATPSVSPREASLYFNKTECFCFTRQDFAAHEEKLMPVTFIVDRDIPKHVNSLVLSYTFFKMDEES